MTPDLTLRLIGRLVTIGVLAVALGASSASAQGQGAAPRTVTVAWQELLGAGSSSFDFKAGTVLPSGVLVVAAMVYRVGGDLDGTAPIALWRIDFAAKVPKVEALTEAITSATSKNDLDLNAVTDINGVVSMGSDSFVLLLEQGDGRAALLEIKGNGTVLGVERLSGPARTISAFGVVPTTGDRELLIFGHETFDEKLLTIGLDGRVALRRTWDRGKMDFFVDALISNDGGFYLVANSGQYDFLYRGSSVVSIGSYDGKSGERVKAKTYNGRSGRMARLSDRDVVVVYDGSSTDAQEIWAVALDAGLEETWRTSVLKVEQGYARFRVVSAPGGGMLVGGGKADKPFVKKLDERGAVDWTFWGREMASSIDHELFVVGDDVVVASSVFDKAGQQRVRVFRLADSPAVHEGGD